MFDLGSSHNTQMEQNVSNMGFGRSLIITLYEHADDLVKFNHEAMQKASTL